MKFSCDLASSRGFFIFYFPGHVENVEGSILHKALRGFRHTFTFSCVMIWPCDATLGHTETTKNAIFKYFSAENRLFTRSKI